MVLVCLRWSTERLQPDPNTSVSTAPGAGVACIEGTGMTGARVYIVFVEVVSSCSCVASQMFFSLPDIFWSSRGNKGTG